MMYNELVESCFFDPIHVGTVDLTQPLSAHHREGEVSRGDVFDFYLLCNKKGLVQKARFKAYGNPYLVAALEWICRQMEGSWIDGHPQFNFARLVKEFAIPKNRHPAALQIEDAYLAVILMMKMKLKEVKQ